MSLVHQLAMFEQDGIQCRIGLRITRFEDGPHARIHRTHVIRKRAEERQNAGTAGYATRVIACVIR